MSPADQIGPSIYRFGSFEIDLEQRLLLRAGESIPLTPKAFDTLAVLVSRPGKLIEKADLLKLVWPDTFVEENNLTQNISVLRKALGDSEYIETVPRRGYRFLPEVERLNPPPLAPPTAELKPARMWFRSTWFWSAVAATLVAALCAAVFQAFRSSPRAEYHVDSLVVLPFLSFPSNQETEYFSDGLTEELTNSLAQVKDLRVVARTSAFQFKGKAEDIRSIAGKLQVGTVLEGSVRREDRRLRVTVQLIDAVSGYHIWSHTFDRDAGDVISIQEDISNQVARTIRPDHKPAARGTRNVEAYNSYLLGRFYRNRPDTPSRERALSFYRDAIQKDQQFAAAYAGLAESYALLAWESAVPPVDALVEAQKAVNKALTLDPDLPEAHTSQGIVNLQLARNWPEAENHFRRALALNPNDAVAHHWFSHYFLAMGRIDESLAESNQALKLDPLDVQISGHLSWHYLRARDYTNAIKAGLRTLELDPHSELAYTFLAWSYENVGQWENAIDAFEHTGRAHPDITALQAGFQSGGPRGYWNARLKTLLQSKTPKDYQLAVVYGHLGEAAAALDRLERAFQLRQPELVYIKRDQAFDFIAANPRFMAITQAMRLP